LIQAVGNRLVHKLGFRGGEVRLSGKDEKNLVDPQFILLLLRIHALLGQVRADLARLFRTLTVGLS